MLVALALGAALASHLGTRLLVRVAPRLGLCDEPTPGKIHTQPVPTLGGIPIILAFLTAVWLFQGLDREGLGTTRLIGLTAASFLVTGLGVYDDLCGLSAWGKLVGQALAGIVLFLGGFRVIELTNPFEQAIPLGWLAAPATILWLLVVTNAINVIDGLDGLAAGVVIIGTATLVLVAWRFDETLILVLALLLGSATVGFLPLNWPPARVFLGDTGSLALGFTIGAISLLENRKGTIAVTLLLPIVLLAIPLLDATLALGRRVRRGRHPFQRDTEHLHHRLLQLGLTPRQILTVVYGVCVYLGLAAYLISVMPKQFVLLVVLILGLGGLLGLRTLVFLERASERRGRRG
jgi:UDP-GlcNAc:undecaprenyl-phosphate/decaprenyl-phosphate GlcNAc-1-phosphate transferase